MMHKRCTGAPHIAAQRGGRSHCWHWRHARSGPTTTAPMRQPHPPIRKIRAGNRRSPGKSRPTNPGGRSMTIRCSTAWSAGRGLQSDTQGRRGRLSLGRGADRDRPRHAVSFHFGQRRRHAQRQRQRRQPGHHHVFRHHRDHRQRRLASHNSTAPGRRPAGQIDVWGRIRRLVESDVAKAQASAADVAAARLSAQITLAEDYFQLRAADEQMRLYQTEIDDFQTALTITQNQVKAGITTLADVYAAETQLESTQARRSACSSRVPNSNTRSRC
jgi:hypothetical protein